MISKVHALFFSPTLTSKKVVEAIAKGVAENLNIPSSSIDITTPAGRTSEISFASDDLVVFGVPVYIGRVPNLLKGYFATIKGCGATGVPVVVYGNRAYDDALLELKDMMAKNCRFQGIVHINFLMQEIPKIKGLI